jgi:hypothetical protein
MISGGRRLLEAPRQVFWDVRRLLSQRIKWTSLSRISRRRDGSAENYEPVVFTAFRFSEERGEDIGAHSKYI